MAEGVQGSSVFAILRRDHEGVDEGPVQDGGQTAKALKQIEGIGSKLGGLGAVWGASLGAAIAVASESSPRAQVARWTKSRTRAWTLPLRLARSSSR